MARRKKTHLKSRSLRRKVNTRELRQRFLIVCEGQKTEPNYFQAFRVPKDVRTVVIGVGANTISLVEKAMDLRQEDDYDQVWCVFDKDDFTPAQFNDAIQLARQNDIQVAYSNEAFELWYILHFNYHQAATSRHRYGEKLSDLLGVNYEKNALDMYERLEAQQETAIRYAEKLLAYYQPHNPADDNPCTTVHLLVQELNRFAV
jgi:hypothetical protein